MLAFEGEPEAAELEERRTLEIAAEAGGRALDPALAQRWWDRRYDFYRPPHQPELPAIWGTLDVVATYDRIGAVYDALHRAVREPYAYTGLELRMHFSHWYLWGTMIYGRFVVPDGGPDALALHDRIWADGMTAALDAGGVMNDHHGVGIKLGPIHAPPAWRRARRDARGEGGAGPERDPQPGEDGPLAADARRTVDRADRHPGHQGCGDRVRPRPAARARRRAGRDRHGDRRRAAWAARRTSRARRSRPPPATSSRACARRGRAARRWSACRRACASSALRLYAEGRLQGALCLGGAEGGLLGAAAMHGLPVGVPKLIVTPSGSGRREFGPFMGETDTTVMHSVVDILGLHPISRAIFDNAAAAVVGMARDGGGAVGDARTPTRSASRCSGRRRRA